MLKVVVGHSDDPNSSSAIAEVIEQCVLGLSGESPQAGILIAALDFNHSLILEKINKAFPGIELIGGTADGEISSVMGFQQDSLVLMLFTSDRIEICAGLGRGVSKNTTVAAQQALICAIAKTSQPAKFCITIPEAMTASGDTIVESLKQTLGSNIPVFGGMSSVQPNQQENYQFFQTEVLRDSIPILLFSGSVQFSHGVASGWRPIGKPCKVTKAEKNIVYEIDGKPALDFYYNYLGQAPSSEYPLGIFEADGKTFRLRAPNSHNSEIGWVKFLGDVPEDTIVQITEAERDEILIGAETSIQQALKAYPGTNPSAVIFFSCVSRRHFLGSHTRLEYELAKRYIGNRIAACGFYTYGEIAPLTIGGETRLHNETFITLLLGAE